MDDHEAILNCYARVKGGAKKAQIEDEIIKITAYRVGIVIRIDVKLKMDDNYNE